MHALCLRYLLENQVLLCKPASDKYGRPLYTADRQYVFMQYISAILKMKKAVKIVPMSMV